MINLRKIIGSSKLIWKYRAAFNSGKDFFQGVNQSSFYRPHIKVEDFLTRIGI